MAGSRLRMKVMLRCWLIASEDAVVSVRANVLGERLGHQVGG